MQSKQFYLPSQPKYTPPRGKGLHPSFYAFSCRCAEQGIPKECCRHLIDTGLAKHTTHRDPTDHEIDDAIRDAYEHVLNRGSAGALLAEGMPSKPWRRGASELPPFCRDLAEAERRRGLTLLDLKAASVEEIPTVVSPVLRETFDPARLICMSVGRQIHRAHVSPLERLLAIPEPFLMTKSYLVPHPMIAPEGVTKDGRDHRPRTQNNTGARRHIVCDFDAPDPDLQPSIIAALNDYWTPILIMRTGGKGLHCWFRIGDAGEDDVRTFERIAARFGADPKLLGEASRNQWVRTPNAIRDNGKKQELIFWNPEGLEVSL